MMKKVFFLLCIVFYNFIQAQFTVDFSPAPYPQKYCNNLQGNYIGKWLPTHGTPHANNYNRVELKVKDAGYPDYKIKTEGVFIDLTFNGLHIRTGNKYRATFYYQKPGPEPITFKAYLAKSMNESSDSNCGETPTPNKPNTKALYNSRNFLSTTYSNHIRTVTVDFTVNSNDYKYLWLHSDHLSKYSNDIVSSIYFTRVSINYNGPNNCNLIAPSSRYTNDLTETSARLNWSSVNGNNGYQYQYKKTSSNSWYSGSESTTYKIINNLKSDTEYEWRVRTKCSNGLYGKWSSSSEFKTLSGCLSDLSITTNVLNSQIDNQSAQNTITATNIINTNATANYDAGSTVYLKPGFHAKSSANFRGFIEGCIGSRPANYKITSIKDASIEDKMKAIVEVYPNPTNGKITIESKETIVSWSLSTMHNKVLEQGSKNKQSINIANFEKGIYVLRVVLTNGKIITKKVIKQ